ncbi:hypothetical protein A2U01_0074996, partial [Trifolium medium]|nr:hypothetical protein [Trifolium medium]
MGNPEE